MNGIGIDTPSKPIKSQTAPNPRNPMFKNHRGASIPDKHVNHILASRHLSTLALLAIGVLVNNSYAGEAGVNINNIAIGPPYFTSDNNNPNPPPPGCTPLPCVDVPIDFDLTRDCIACDGTEGPEMRIVALDCNDHIVAEELRQFSSPPPCIANSGQESISISDQHFIFPACLDGKIITRIDVYTARDHINFPIPGIPPPNDCPGNSVVDWNVAPQASLDMPIPEQSCMLTGEALSCYACSDVINLPPDLLIVYKTEQTLYGLSSQDNFGVGFGEVVNGVFIAPGPGLLHIEEITSKPSISTWYNGWQSATGRSGTPLVDKACQQITSAGQAVRFHIRVGRVDNRYDYKLKFTWIEAAPRNCCMQHAEEILSFHVIPFGEVTHSSDSSLPTRRIWVRYNGSLDYEMTIPTCAACAGGGCHSSNMSAPFIVWPTTSGAVIREGHARGWSLTSTTLNTPGPQSTVYHY